MYKVIVLHRRGNGVNEAYHDIKGLDQLELSAVGLSVKVIVRDLLGEVVDVYCGADVQVHVYRV